MTNIFIYPVNGVVFPVIFKIASEKRPDVTESIVGSVLSETMRALGVQKGKAWKNYTALVSLGGVFGPVLSSFMIPAIQAYARKNSSINVGLSGVRYGKVEPHRK